MPSSWPSYAIWIMYPTLYVTFAKTPLVWQGRYNLPLLGGLTLAVVSLHHEPRT